VIYPIVKEKLMAVGLGLVAAFVRTGEGQVLRQFVVHGLCKMLECKMLK
jgi:hypothetical protein